MNKILLSTILASLTLLSACAPVIVGGAVVSGISVANDRRSAGDAAAARQGVVRVINELHDAAPTDIERRAKDSYITTKAKSSLVRVKLSGFNPTRVRVMTTRGVVYLMGRVTHDEANAVVEKIRNLRGVRRVVKVFEYI